MPPDNPIERVISDIVLIVDDIPENLSFLHDALDESGYTVLVATNGESALQRARQMKQARTALDAFGQATVAVRASDGKLVWQTPLSRKLLKDYFTCGEDETPPRLLAWIAEAETARRNDREPPALLLADGSRRLLASFHDQTGDQEWLVVLREENDASAIESLIAAFRLTQREAEVLYWVTLGKTSKDIGDILGSSPRTVNKHLEHVFEKLGVETRTAAANLALGRMRGA